MVILLANLRSPKPAHEAFACAQDQVRSVLLQERQKQDRSTNAARRAASFKS